MKTDLLRFMKLYKAMSESLYFTATPMSYIISGNYAEGTTLFSVNGTEKYILLYRTENDGRIWFNILPAQKDGTALPVTA